MANAESALELRSHEAQPRHTVWTVAGIALAVGVLHMLTNGRYGFHRDELQTLSDALHLDWGFVAYPPFTPLVERVAMSLFGVSMVGLRLFSVIAQSAAIFFTGAIARELGGDRWAQTAAALGTALAPLALFEGTEFQYTTFDYLWWVLIAYFVVRLLNTEDPRWCAAIGGVIGLGLMTKYTMVFYVAGIVAGLALTRARRFLASRWFWIGAALALLIFLPNLIWQFRHDFISLHFLQHIHKRDVGEGRADNFWLSQFFLDAGRMSAPLWLAGVFGFARSSRYRTLLWMCVTPEVILWLSKGRFYYMGAIYPILFAMGAVVIAGWLKRLPTFGRAGVWSAYLLLMLYWAVTRSAQVILPLHASGPGRDYALSQNGDLREEIGWDDLVKTVAAIRDSLSPEQQKDLGIVVGNYGEQGAIEILGRPYHLPSPISTTNSAWLRGYPTPTPGTLIVLGISHDSADRRFTSCRLAGHNGNSLGIENEESKDHPDILICGPPRLPWPELWKKYQNFG